MFNIGSLIFDTLKGQILRVAVWKKMTFTVVFLKHWNNASNPNTVKSVALHKFVQITHFEAFSSQVSQVVLNRICAKAISGNSATERFAESKTNQPVLNCNLSPTGADPSLCTRARQNLHHRTTEEVRSGRWLNKILFAPRRRFATTSSGRNSQDTQLWLKTRRKTSINVYGNFCSKWNRPCYCAWGCQSSMHNIRCCVH